MARTFLPEPLEQYLFDVLSPRTPVQERLRKETQGLPQAGMQIGPDQGLFLGLLVRMLDARRVVEIGTFTGYSALAMAMALPPGGRVLCCDVSEEFTAIARRYWERAGVDDRIELRLAPAVETLRTLPADPPIDLAFIDADKEGYVDYWEEIMTRLRPGGVILVDNVFSNGRVVADDPGPTGTAIQRFNDHAAADDRVELAMLPIADGLTFARKR